ncbi:MAG: serine/threonine transporter SstT [Butyricicoccus sp.]
MKQAWKKWNDMSLILRIVIGLVIGLILALVAPQATAIAIFGTMFVGALKAIAPILVFILVMSSLAQATEGIGKRFRTVIVLYMLSTFLAAVLAVFASFLFPVTLKLTQAAGDTAPPSGIGEVFTNLLNNIVSNPVTALSQANYVGILAWSVLLGLALKKIASPKTKETLKELSDAVSQVVRWIINLAPIGIMGLIFSAVSENGLAIFQDYGKLLLLLVGCMLSVALIIDPLIAAICLHRNPYPLVFRCFKESGVTAFFTRSSAANIPVNMALCDRLGLDKNVYSVSIPLGATINMDGAAITITVMTLAAAHTVGVNVGIPTAIILSLLATVAACGASGVAGGSLLLIPMACSLFGISNDIAMQVVAVGFIIGVVQDSFETAINSAGDVLFAATAEFREWIKEGREVTF